GQQAPRLQGGPQRHRGPVAGQQVGLLLRLHRPGRAPLRFVGRDRAGGAPPVPVVRRADTVRGVRLLQARQPCGPTCAAGAVSRPFAAGERALFFDNKGRRYLVTLAEGGEFHTHSGPVAHDDVLGEEEGCVVRSTRGARYTAVRPTLSEVVLKMPR